eukprot:00078.XXX_1303_545_1 [CDS] Oithona nana genome sequencing.
MVIMATEETKEELLQNALLQRPLPFSINNILHQTNKESRDSPSPIHQEEDLDDEV